MSRPVESMIVVMSGADVTAGFFLRRTCLGLGLGLGIGLELRDIVGVTARCLGFRVRGLWNRN